MDMHEFLRRVWGDQKGYAFLGYGTTHSNFVERAYHYPEQLDEFIAEAKKQNEWANVYFCIHLCVSNRRIKETVIPNIYTLWMDHDAGYPDTIDPRPSVCWQTSEGKFQAVWFLENPVTPQEAEKVNKFLCKKYKADNKWYLTSYLRLPETINHKYVEPYKGFYLWTDGTTYSLDTFIPAFTQDANNDDATEIGDIPDNLPSYSEIIAEYGGKIPQAAWRILSKEPDENSDWSEVLWKLERLLIEAGLSAEAVFVITRDSSWNKYRRDNRPDIHLWVEINKAIQANPQPPAEQEGFKWLDMPRLITFSERPTWLVQDVWINHTVGFAAGVGKSYKSTLTLDLALSIASGTPFLDMFEVVNPGPVLMVQEEDPLWRVAHRVQVIAEHKGLTGTTVESGEGNFLLEINPLPNIPFYTAVGNGFAFTEPEKCDALEAAIAHYKPKIVFLDPLFMLNPGMDEYKSGDMVFALNKMKYWRNKYGCAICVVHHFRKSGGDVTERLYGSMALYAWSENNLFFQRGKGNIVSISRDIKDATRDLSEIQVRVDDIADSYDITTDFSTPKIDGVSDSFNKVLQVLSSGPAGGSMLQRDIVKHTGLTRKTVTSVLQDMEEAGLIRLERTSARGNPLQAIILRKLFEQLPDVDVKL